MTKKSTCDTILEKTNPADMRLLQERIGRWADRTFPIKNRKVFSAFSKMVMEEIPEFIHSGMKDPKELGDIGVLLLDIAYILDIDLYQAISDKMDINEFQRKWEQDPKTGLMSHVTEN